MLTDQQIKQQAALNKDYVIQCRRTIHRFAEPSGTEVKTSAFVQAELTAASLPFEVVSKTGVLAILDTGRPGPHIALRADIDALPMPEEPNNLAGARVCVSENPKTCHACGHDAHTAMLLGAVKAFVACKDSLVGVLYFCFEEGEENGGGLPGMLAALEKYQVDTCWTIHVYAGLDSGKICVDAGPRMAGAAGVEIKVIGKGGHGSRPDMAINPVFCAAEILSNVAAAWANQITPGKVVTLGIGSIQGGTTGNVIPDTAEILGSLRFFDMAEGAKGVEIFKSVATHTAAMNKCTVEFSPRFEVLVGSVINDPAYAALAKTGLEEILPENTVSPCEPWYASESFSEYSVKYPCVMAHLGINNPAYGSGAAHHNGFFDVDEDVMQIGLISTLKYVATVANQAK
ncbi:MAG: amidohydrolase [Ruthenibacterium sp.]